MSQDLPRASTESNQSEPKQASKPVVDLGVRCDLVKGWMLCDEVSEPSADSSVGWEAYERKSISFNLQIVLQRHRTRLLYWQALAAQLLDDLFEFSFQFNKELRGSNEFDEELADALTDAVAGNGFTDSIAGIVKKGQSAFEHDAGRLVFPVSKVIGFGLNPLSANVTPDTVIQIDREPLDLESLPAVVSETSLHTRAKLFIQSLKESDSRSFFEAWHQFEKSEVFHAVAKGKSDTAAKPKTAPPADKAKGDRPKKKAGRKHRTEPQSEKKRASVTQKKVKTNQGVKPKKKPKVDSQKQNVRQKEDLTQGERTPVGPAIPASIRAAFTRAHTNGIETLSGDDLIRISEFCVERAKQIREAEIRQQINALAHDVFPELASDEAVTGERLTEIFAARSRAHLEAKGRAAKTAAAIPEADKPKIAAISQLIKHVGGSVSFDGRACRLHIEPRSDSKAIYWIKAGEDESLWKRVVLPPVQFKL